MGCEQEFYPFAKGPSMVFEFTDSKNAWPAMVAFEEATLQCDPARIGGCLPLAFPQTHPLEVPIPGVARFAVDNGHKRESPSSRKQDGERCASLSRSRLQTKRIWQG